MKRRLLRSSNNHADADCASNSRLGMTLNYLHGFTIPTSYLDDTQDELSATFIFAPTLLHVFNNTHDTFTIIIIEVRTSLGFQ